MLVGVFIPTNPSQNTLLILDTNIIILISTSIKVFLQHQVHKVTDQLSHHQLPGSLISHHYFLLPRRVCKDFLEVMHCLCFLPLCCSSMGAAAFLQIFSPWDIWSILLSWQFLLLWLPLCHLCGHHHCFHAWFWVFHQPGPWTMAAEMLQMVLCMWPRVMGMSICFVLTWPGAMIHSVSPSQTVGIVRVWEALGLLLLFFFFLL